MMKKLPKVLMEAPNELEELPREELESMLGAHSPDDVADRDYVDSDTGEIVWEKGEKLSATHFWQEQNPSAKPADVLSPEEAELERSRAEEDAEAEAEDQRNASAHDDLMALVNEYASQYQSTASELGVKPEDAAPDLALSFFLMHPEWKDLARRAGLSKEAVRSMVADTIYEVMTKGDVQEVVRMSASQLREVINNTVLEISGGPEFKARLKAAWDKGADRREKRGPVPVPVEEPDPVGGYYQTPATGGPAVRTGDGNYTPKWLKDLRDPGDYRTDRQGSKQGGEQGRRLKGH